MDGYSKNITPIRVLYGLTEPLSFELVSELNTYESLTFERKYTSYGTFELQINAKDSAAKELKKGRLLYINKYKCGVIKYRNVKNGQNATGDILVVKGFTLEHINTQRITIPPQGKEALELNTDIASIVYHLIVNNIGHGNGADIVTGERLIDQLRYTNFEPQGNTVSFRTRYEQLDEEIERALNLGEQGLRYILDVNTKSILYEVYTGKDRSSLQTTNSPVMFSRDFANISTSNLTDDESNYKNTAYVAGQGEGIEREVQIINEKESAAGIERVEMFVDARDIEDPSLLPNRGREKLKEKEKVFTVEGEVNPYNTFEFEKDYFLGDKVSVVISDVDKRVIKHVRITEVKETWNSKGYSVNVVFDKRVQNIIDKIDDKIKAKTVQRELPKVIGGGTDDALLKGKETIGTGMPTTVLTKTDTPKDPLATLYDLGIMQFKTHGTLPVIGFHTQGVSACALYEKSGKLHTMGNDGIGGQICLEPFTVRYNAGDALGHKDARGRTILPTDYIGDKKSGLTLELVDGNQVGLPGMGIGHAITSSPWGDLSGAVIQRIILKGSYKSYIRYATSNNTWSDTLLVPVENEVMNLQFNLPVSKVNDPNWKQAYSGDITNTVAGQIGLPDDNWYHIIYQPHTNNTGYGGQYAQAFNDGGMYYRSSNSMTWYPWRRVSSTHKTHVTTNGGWFNAADCMSTYVVSGNLLTFNAVVYGNGTNNFPFKLPVPKDAYGVPRWAAGSAIGSNSESRYLVIQPDGWLCFQYGYTPNVPYAITVSYPI